MQNSQFERLLKLAQRTGDRLIVTDPSGHEPVVILPLEEYEGLLDYGSFRKGRKDRDIEEGAYEDVPKPQPQKVEDEMDGEFDPEALEEQVIAAMNVEEPRMIPVEPIPMPPLTEEGPADLVEEAATVLPPSDRRAITRKPKVEDGEEQFYLEPV